LCGLPTYEQKRLALDLVPLEYLHDSFETLSPPPLDDSHVRSSDAPGGSTPDRARAIPAPQHREQKTPIANGCAPPVCEPSCFSSSDLRASLPH
jgi:hypothetical protein